MSNETTSPTSGQETDPSINPHSDLAKILEAIRKLATSITILEQRFEYLDRDVLKAIKAASLPVPEHLIEPRDEPGEDEEDEPLTEPGLTPALALRSDGTVLIAPQYVEGANLEGREVWTGVALTLAESCDALDAMNDAASDAAAHIGGRLIALARKKKAKDEGGNGSE
jgi:hypothetical protein